MPTIETFAGYPESTILITEEEGEVISEALMTEADNVKRTSVAASVGLAWVMDTLEPQWEGRGIWPRNLTLLDIQWEVIEETLENQGREVIVTNLYSGKDESAWQRIDSSD